MTEGETAKIMRRIRSVGILVGLAVLGLAAGACDELTDKKGVVIRTVNDSPEGSGGVASADASTPSAGGDPGSGGTGTGGTIGAGGKTGGPGGSPPTRTLHGIIDSPTVADVPPGELGVAILWYPEFGTSDIPDSSPCEPLALSNALGHVVPQEIPVTGTFPYTFDLPTSTPPLAAAMRPFEDGTDGSFAMGQIVAYRDGDHDGQLDVVSGPATSPDEILGQSSTWIGTFQELWNDVSYVVAYSTVLNEIYDPAYQPGYNLYRDTVGDVANSAREAVPLDTEITLHYALAHRTSTLICEGICIIFDDIVCPETPAGLPEGGEGRCLPATTQFWASYEWTNWSCDGCTCTSKGRCNFVIDPELPVPGGWPCE
jgi:hypothetical protein